MVGETSRTASNHESAEPTAEDRKCGFEVLRHMRRRLLETILDTADDTESLGARFKQVREDRSGEPVQSGTLDLVQGKPEGPLVIHRGVRYGGRRGTQKKDVAALTTSRFGGTLTPPISEPQPQRETMDRRSVRSLDDPETLKLLIRSIGEGIYITDSK